MNVYLDSSALVKLYVHESGSLDTIDLIDGVESVATSSISRVEVVSALARAVRGGIIDATTGREAYEAFVEESRALVQVPATDRVLERAQEVVWHLGLRSYDAVQLASALTWKERIGAGVTLATFDDPLTHAAEAAGIDVWPGRNRQSDRPPVTRPAPRARTKRRARR